MSKTWKNHQKGQKTGEKPSKILKNRQYNTIQYNTFIRTISTIYLQGI